MRSISWVSRLTWPLAAVVLAGSVALALSPSYTALGDSGPPEHYPGSIRDLKPSYASILLAAGIAIAVLGALAAVFRHALFAGLACGIALGAGVSIDSVDVVIDNPVIYRSYSVLELRGTGPSVAALASLSAFLASFGLTTALVLMRRGRSG